MRKNNPFSIAFGKAPAQTINRDISLEEIYDSFESDIPSSQVYMLTGVRGYGKTVTLTEIARHYSEDPEWVVINMSPTRDLLLQLAANLYEDQKLSSLFVDSNINLSAFGIGINISNKPPITDIELINKRLLEIVKKHKKRVLITIDEVTNSEYIKVFASAFQIMLREDLPVFLLMTGLYENIKDLQNEKALTFLYRAPRVELKPLSVGLMAISYKDIFDCSLQEATDLAKITKGYPYAFQVLGYLKWNMDKPLEELLETFDLYMEESVYEKIWSELSEKDREILVLLANDGRMRTGEILSKSNHSQSTYSTYRSRLQKKGLIDTSSFGYAELRLPRFDVFIKRKFWEMEQ